MKKVLNFLQSMRFGMILLALVLLCSVIGSFIPQGNEAEYYENIYPNFGSTIVALDLHQVFSSWYFLVLLALLCVNLLFCSVLRLGRTARVYRAMPEGAAKAVADKLMETDGEKIEALLKARHFHRVKTASGVVYGKNRAGHYGTFVVHLSLLLLLVSAAGALYFSGMDDISLREGESYSFSTGAQMQLLAFRSASESGEVIYESDLAITDKHGAQRQDTVTVNYPISVDGQKVFQMGYGIEGLMTITNDGQESELTLTNADIDSFLTLDGETGVVFTGIYPDYVQNEDGSIDVVRMSKLGYPNPIYTVYVIDGENSGNGVVVPGTTMRVGGVDYTFEKPINISTMRVKTYPQGVFALLYASFALITIGIWLAFFMVPVYVRVDKKGYALRSLKAVPELEAELKKAADRK